MAQKRYPSFGKIFAKHLIAANSESVASAMGIAPTQVDEAKNGDYLPTLQEINALAAHLKLSRRAVGKLVDSAMDDLAAVNDAKPQAAPKKSPRTSPRTAINRW